jgi:creatinine amidohydrolase/Fe(II)-dependent formamide hydrolase-like protein
MEWSILVTIRHRQEKNKTNRLKTKAYNIIPSLHKSIKFDGMRVVFMRKHGGNGYIADEIFINNTNHIKSSKLQQKTNVLYTILF